MKVKIFQFKGWQVQTSVLGLGWFVIGVYETEAQALRACSLNGCEVIK